MTCVSPPPSNFRTAVFPATNPHPALCAAAHPLRRPCSPLGQVGRGRSPECSRLDLEALGSPDGSIVRPGPPLIMASSLRPSPRFMSYVPGGPPDCDNLLFYAF